MQVGRLERPQQAPLHDVERCKARLLTCCKSICSPKSPSHATLKQFCLKAACCSPSTTPVESCAATASGLRERQRLAQVSYLPVIRAIALINQAYGGTEMLMVNPESQGLKKQRF